MNYGDNSAQIIFYREGKNRYKSSFQRHFDLRSLYLLDDSYHLDILNLIPRLFTITTNNGSYQFNIEILKDTSSVISEFLEKNPTTLEYHLDINDEEKILEKIEQMYQGKLVVFSEEELPICKKFTNILNIKNCPNYMKPEILKTQGDGFDFGISLNEGVGLSTDNFNLFIQNDIHRTFSITTKNKEYKCNFFGVFYSKLIRDQILENPSKRDFYYDYDDEFSEFQSICKLFNFEMIDITTDNAHFLKEISEDLRIDFVLEKIDKNIEEYEKVSQTIDDNQTLVDSIEDLFNLLYNIQQNSVDFVKNWIIESNWSKSRDDVLELAAFILQVINADFSYHSTLIDLLIKLDEEAEETNSLNLLIPIIIDKLMNSFGRRLIECSFIYNLFKKDVIKKDLIINELNKIIRKRPNDYGDFDKIEINICLWFLPELIELNWNQLKFFSNKEDENFVKIEYPNIWMKLSEKKWKKFILKYYPNKIESYKKMRESGEPDDELTKALRKDDVDTVQLIISNHKIDFINAVIPFNIYEYFVPNGETTYLNYAAAYGSIKCFKYLLLNHVQIDENTFKFAVFGGNIEIVKIVNQNQSNLIKVRKINNNYNYNNTNNNNEHDIVPSIIKHQNDLFDWICQEKIASKGIIEKLSQNLIKLSVENGNPHSFIEIVDKGIDFSPYFMDLIQLSSEKGFYKLTQLIFNINVKKTNKELKDEKLVFSCNLYNSKIPYISFGSLSIFELSLKLEYVQKDLDDSLSYAIEMNYFNIIHYFFDTLFKKNSFKITQRGAFNALENSLDKDSLDIFNYLIEQYEIANPSIFNNFNGLIQLLLKACKIPCFEAVKTLTSLIVKDNKNEDFTLPFINAASSKSFEICRFFVDQKLVINFEGVSSSFSKLGSITTDIFSLMYDNSSPEVKNTYLNLYLCPAIRNKNKELVEFLLKLNPIIDNALIEAACCDDIEIVDIILNYKSNPCFINRKDNGETALSVAIKKSNLLIVKRLLSLKGIDLNSLNKNKQTPLILAVSRLNIEIIEVIFEFYGDYIKNQTWQLEKSLMDLLNLLSSDSRKKSEEIIIVKIMKKFLDIENINLNLLGDKYTILTYACEVNEIDLVKMLLKSSRIDVNMYELSESFTPLMVSIENKNIEIAKLLIQDERTNINYRNNDGKTPLVIAVNQHLSEIITLLINNDRFDPEESELNYAFYLSNKEAAKLLIPLNSLDVNFSLIQYQYVNYDYINSIGVSDYSKLELYETPLVSSTQVNDIEKIDLIIHHHSFDQIRSQLKKSIFLAAKNDQIEIFRKLIQLIDNDVNISTAFGNLLDTAVVNLSQKIIKEILSNPKFDSKANDIRSIFIGITTKFIHYFDEENNELIEIMNELCDYDEKHEKLIDFNSLLPNGFSYFTVIFSSNYIEDYVDFFLKRGVDPNAPDKNGVYPLEHAIRIESYPFVLALLNSDKIDLSVKINNNNPSSLYRTNKEYLTESKYKSYLHLAARFSNVEIFDVFLNRNLIDINITDDLGETPLIEAFRFQQFPHIESLFKRDDLDFLHCNNKGQDALNIFSDSQKINITDKEEYCNALFAQIESKKNSFGIYYYNNEECYDYSYNHQNYECFDDIDIQNFDKIYGEKDKYDCDNNYEDNYEDNYNDIYDNLSDY